MFPIARLLELHVLETHDTLFALLAKKQNMVCRCTWPEHARERARSCGA
jgi:hypothetical protein